VPGDIIIETYMESNAAITTGAGKVQRIWSGVKSGHRALLACVVIYGRPME